MSSHMIAPRVKCIRARIAEAGRDPNSVKVFTSILSLIGRTWEEAEAKRAELSRNSSEEGGLVY